MNITQIEANLKKLISSFSKESFIYDLLLAYGLPKASITRLKKGNLNLSKVAGEVSWKKKLFFKEEYKEDLHLTVFASLTNEVKQDQRFVVVTDYETLLSVDTKTGDKLDIPLKDLPKHYDFFLPWAGLEKGTHHNEREADVKAAVNMAKLFDAIKEDNPDDSPEFIHGLNVFLSRLLFCFFAEDTHIFKDNQFTNAIDSHTQADGSDSHDYLNTLFDVLNTPEDKRHNLPTYLNAFPYVNGGLFKDKLPAPVFTKSSRAAMLSSGDQDWSAINPDIFGSMFQAVISTGQRGTLGQHYTSVPNIMKVIEPLFLNDLYKDFDTVKGNPKKLMSLLERLSNLKIFDPACGSGNFLIIAYKELRKLEMLIIRELQKLNSIAKQFAPGSEQLSIIPKAQLELAAKFQVELFSRIHLSNFYGIEIDDFAHEIAKLALWLAEHQMNMEFNNEFGRTNPTLPLKEAGQIVLGNAVRLDWDQVCPKAEVDEVYLLGNPPYLGSSLQEEEQKLDVQEVFQGKKNFKNLDYIACWFLKASKYIRGIEAQLAFVTTNSICQGEQVMMLWPHIFDLGQEIGFAHTSFKWGNNAKSNAAVFCVIIGVRNISTNSKTLFGGHHSKNVPNINPYLVPTKTNLILGKRRGPISHLPQMTYGNKPTDGGNLLLTPTEKEALVAEYPEAKKFIRRIVGAREFTENLERWCVWIDDDCYEEAKLIKAIQERLELVSEMRRNSKKAATQKLALYPHRFGEIRHQPLNAIIVPRHGSDKREYFPFGFLSSDIIVSDAAQIIYTDEPYVFGVISSGLHMCWIKASCGKIKEDPRYSSSLGYNNFPFPPISTQRKNELTQCAFRILEEREKDSDKTLAELYDPDKMPEGLREAHLQNDLAIERCFRSKPFESDEERLEYLFKLYEKMIQEEQERGTLFAKEKKTRKKRS